MVFPIVRFQALSQTVHDYLKLEILSMFTFWLLYAHIPLTKNRNKLFFKGGSEKTKVDHKQALTFDAQLLFLMSEKNDGRAEEGCPS